jgi:hypothetical protein
VTDPETPTDPRELRAEIARTRSELGETVEELAAKADVKARAKQAVGDATGRMRQKASEAAGVMAGRVSKAWRPMAGADRPESARRPLPLTTALVAVAAVIVVVVVVVRRRR